MAMRPDCGYGLFRGFLVPWRFELECRPPSLEDVAFKFANFFIKAEKGRRRPSRPGWSNTLLAFLLMSVEVAWRWDGEAGKQPREG